MICTAGINYQRSHVSCAVQTWPIFNNSIILSIILLSVRLHVLICSPSSIPLVGNCGVCNLMWWFCGLVTITTCSDRSLRSKSELILSINSENHQVKSTSDTRVQWSALLNANQVIQDYIHRITGHFWSENFFRRAEQKCCGYWIRSTASLV